MKGSGRMSRTICSLGTIFHIPFQSCFVNLKKKEARKRERKERKF